MKMIRRSCRVTLLFAVACPVALVLSACDKSGDSTSTGQLAAAVKSIALGSAVNEDTRQVTDPSTTFMPADKIYATVTSTGPGLDGDEVRMDTDWVYQDGQVVFHSGHKGLAGARLPDLFSASMPLGFKPGKYTFEIKFDGAPAGNKEFTVGQPD